ncbi:hypothetical protein ACI3PL_32935, partial [Lacticaseibacillus paracasei]
MLLGMDGISAEEIARLKACEARGAGRLTPQQMEQRLVSRPDFLTISAPNQAAQAVNLASKTEIKVGEGVLKIEISM